MSRDKFQQRRTACGYQWPGERDGCRNCAHRSKLSFMGDSPNSITYYCERGRFIVAPGGICREHHLAGIASVPVEIRS